MGLFSPTPNTIPSATDIDQLTAAVTSHADIGVMGAFSALANPSVAPTAAPLTATADLNNTEWYCYTFITGVLRNGSPYITGETLPSPISSAVTAQNQAIQISDIALGPVGVIGRRLYRAPAIPNPSTSLVLTAGGSGSTLATGTYYVGNDYGNSAGRTTLGSSIASIAVTAGQTITTSITLPASATNLGIYVGTTATPPLVGTISSNGIITYAGGLTSGLSVTQSGSTFTITISTAASSSAPLPSSTNTANTEQYRLVQTLPNNAVTTYVDTLPDSQLGALAPTTNTTGTIFQLPLFPSFPSNPSTGTLIVLTNSTPTPYLWNGTTWVPTQTDLVAGDGIAISDANGVFTVAAQVANSSLTNNSTGLSLNVNNPNTWTALQTFGNNLSFGGATVAITGLTTGQALVYNGTNWINADVAFADLSGTATNSQLAGPLVDALVAGNAGIAVTNPTTVGSATINAVVDNATLTIGSSGIALNPAHANIWTAAQTFQGGVVIDAVNGTPTAGHYGVVTTAAATYEGAVGTTSTTLASFTPPGDGTVAVHVYLRPTVTTTVSLTVTYSDAGGAQSDAILNNATLSSPAEFDGYYEATTASAVTITATAGATGVYASAVIEGVS